jgi:hypothetical protein
MEDLGTTAAGLMVALGGLVLLADGILVRLGMDRRWARVYRNSAWPMAVRNGPFLLIPWGAMLAGIGLTALLPETGTLGGVRVVAGFGAIVLMPLSLVGLVRPPQWLLPAWSRENVTRSIPSMTTTDIVLATFVIVLALMSVVAFLLFAIVSRP